jgi:hypothetical protein
MAKLETFAATDCRMLLLTKEHLYMETYFITVYVIVEEVIRILKIKDDPQSIMSNAEVMTFAIITTKFFSGNFKMARYLFKKTNLFSNLLSNSRLNRMIHSVPWDCWHAIFRLLSLLAKDSKNTCYFAVDSFPVCYCQKNRIDKRKCFLEHSYIGFAASKKRYFCGIKVHMVVSNEGRPIEVHLRPGSESDIGVLWSMELDILDQAVMYADGAYNCFELEDILKEEGIQFISKRGSKAKNRVRTIEEEREISSKRQIVETAFSSILNPFPRYIRSRTEKGFY